MKTDKESAVLCPGQYNASEERSTKIKRTRKGKKKVMRFWLREITGTYWCVVSYRLGNIKHSFFCC